MAERTGVYTAFDYADIMEFLIKKWRVRGPGLLGNGKKAGGSIGSQARANTPARLALVLGARTSQGTALQHQPACRTCVLE